MSDATTSITIWAVLMTLPFFALKSMQSPIPREKSPVQFVKDRHEAELLSEKEFNVARILAAIKNKTIKMPSHRRNMFLISYDERLMQPEKGK